MKAWILSLLLSLPLSGWALSVGDPAPDFRLKALSGENIRLGELRGQVVMLNFWASWCPPCLEELPELQALEAKYQRAGFQLLAINLDQETEKAQALLQRLGLQLTALSDSQHQVGRQYGIKSMPSTLLLDRDGRIRFAFQGYQPSYLQQYDQHIRELLKE